jgi:hypothetical protein
MATEKDQCPATIVFRDDYDCTFHCEKEEGHAGKHAETGVQFGVRPYALEWEGDARDEGELGFMHGDGQ